MGTRRGLTLAEVLVALGVASVAVLTLVMFVGLIYRSAREGKTQAAASTLARKAVERLRTDSEFFDLARSSAVQLYTVTPLDAEAAAVNFTTTATCVAIPDTDERYFQARVRVDWNERRPRSVVLETVLPRP